MTALNTFQFILSSLTIFALMALMVECGLKLFKVSNFRVSSICRLLPIIKLPLCLILFEKALLLDVNLLSCTNYFKPFIRNLFTPEVQAEIAKNYSLPNYLSLHIPQIYLSLFLTLFIAITFTLLLLKAIQLYSIYRELKLLCQEAIPCQRAISNPTLKTASILVSNAIDTPTAFGNNTILLPTNLVNQFSQEEFEAVLAHELEHLRWKDPIFKFASILIQSAFWWIPMSWWLKRVEDDQEKACDASIIRHGCESSDLASAILKTLKQNRTNSYELVLSHLAQSYNVVRIRTLLDGSNGNVTLLSRLGILVFVVTFVVVGFRIC